MRPRTNCFLSLHDPLTGLYNRTYFEQQIRRIQESRTRPVGIIVCDMDGLKLVNDTLGHNTGDRLLIIAGRIITAGFWRSRCLRRHDQRAALPEEAAPPGSPPGDSRCAGTQFDPHVVEVFARQLTQSSEIVASQGPHGRAIRPCTKRDVDDRCMLSDNRRQLILSLTTHVRR